MAPTGEMNLNEVITEEMDNATAVGDTHTEDAHPVAFEEQTGLDTLDMQILQAQQTIQSQNQELECLKQELYSLQSQQDQRRIEYVLQLGSLTEERERLEKVLKTSMEDLVENKSSMHKYIQLLREVLGGSMISTYVLPFQAELCRLLHQRGILEVQLKLIQKRSVDLIQYYQSETGTMTDEKSATEINYMNQLFVLDAEIRSLMDQIETEFADQKGLEIGNGVMGIEHSNIREEGDTNRRDTKTKRPSASELVSTLSNLLTVTLKTKSLAKKNGQVTVGGSADGEDNDDKVDSNTTTMAFQQKVDGVVVMPKKSPSKERALAA